MTKPTLPALMEDLSAWFPELEGRCIAVSEVEPFGDGTNMPTLPMAFAALVSATGQQPQRGANITLNDDVLVHFMFEPVKYQKADGNNSAFFAFYDYETLRDKMLSFSQQWLSPRGSGLTFTSMDVEAEERAVLIAFRFNLSEKWCLPEEFAEEPTKVDIIPRMYAAQGTKPCCEPCSPAEDPCADARKENPHGRENWSAG